MLAQAETRGHDPLTDDPLVRCRSWKRSNLDRQLSLCLERGESSRDDGGASRTVDAGSSSGLDVRASTD